MTSLRVYWKISCVILLLAMFQMVQCRYVFHAKIQRETVQHKRVATWDEAEQRCKGEGAILASPLNAELLKYMKSVIAVNNHTTPYFIGTKARSDVDLKFLTEEGILLEDVPDAVDMVEELDPRAGDCLCMDAHSIRTVPCWHRLPYMCYTNVTSTTSATATIIPISTTADTGSPKNNNYATVVKAETKTGCEQNGYKMLGRNCYKLHTNHVTWDEAKKSCEAEGAYLIVINDNSEAAITTDIAIESLSSRYWVGFRDATGNNEWRTVHGDPLSKIHIIKPRTNNNKPRCGTVRYTGVVTDILCDSQHPFICEMNYVH